MENIGRRVGIGIIWMVGARLFDRSIGIVSTVILARLLMPADFGLVAMATAIGAILDLLGAFSFDLALIQNKNAERKHYDTVWTFNVMFGVFCGLCLIVLAHPAAGFYKEARLENVMYVLSLSYFLNAFTNVGLVAFRKDLNFDKEFHFIFWRRLVTFIITIGAALLFRSYWALLMGMTVGRLVSLIMSYKMNDYRPRFSLAASRELFGFSKWLLINNILFFILHRGCTFIIGRLYGTSTLGIYAISREISSLPSTELVAPINRVMFPGFSKMRDVAQISQAYLKLFGLITLTILPIGIGIAAVAAPLVETMLGAKWMAAIPVIQLLAIHGAIGATQGNNGVVWLSLGHPRMTTSVAAIFLVVLFSSLYFFMNAYGVVGVGLAYILGHVVTVPYSTMVSKRLLKFSWPSFFGTLWRPVLAVVAMYAAVHYIDAQLISQPPLLRLIIDSLAGATVYAAVVLLAWRAAGSPDGAEEFVLARVLNGWTTLRRRFT
ncbi:lipopolysaccharide biosynthesis protein [Massilia jejuensis]|uniref:Lipopolysaccharide biosynthesis protein n=1 Tax=Massilia jejuensis TaxID=648894 RepID=A0ABW0PF25_9BURK